MQLKNITTKKLLGCHIIMPSNILIPRLPIIIKMNPKYHNIIQATKNDYTQNPDFYFILFYFQFCAFQSLVKIFQNFNIFFEFTLKKNSPIIYLFIYFL